MFKFLSLLRKFSLAGATLLIGLSGSALIAMSAEAKTIPQAPHYYVLDEPKVLSQSAKEALQTLLVEHDRLTGEQLVLAVFETLDDEELVDFTNRVFSSWKIGKRGKDNGVLLALYWKERKARIEVGYGLEPLLTDAKSKRILSEFLIPELKNRQPDRALTLASLEILRTIESPLIQSGQAEQILKSGGFRGGFQPAPKNGSSWAVWVILGFILLFIALNFLTAADAHFTRGGWYRQRPVLTRRPRDIFWGGWGAGHGGSGGWGSGGGGFGGFRGGGGMSGGGGASGSW